MSATIHTIAGGERNTRLVMQQRRERLETPTMQARLRELQDLLTAHHLSKLTVKDANGKR